MNNNTIILLIIVLVLAGGAWYYGTQTQSADDQAQTNERLSSDSFGDVSVTPISHASFILDWAGTTIYVDPVGDAEAYANAGAPDIIVITHTHGDHLNVDTLSDVVAENTTLFVPQLVYDELPEALTATANVLENGENVELDEFTIMAVSMYNVPESADANHAKGDGNGYVIEQGNTRVYVAGDTGATQEMRALENITTAFVPMNLPYTMDVEDAADGVLAFAPSRVYPYHYRNQDGTLSDVAQFRQLVNDENPDIEVVFLNWYPDRE